MLAALGVTVAIFGSSRSSTAQQAAEPCEAWDVEYVLSAKLQLSDTTMGAGDGTYSIGPGSAVLRFANANGQAGGKVHLRSYAMREHFTIDSKVVFWTTHVLTDSKTTVGRDACGDMARGKLEDRTLRWLSPLSGYRTDGTLTCDGSLCGTFGAPPQGRSELHIPPHNVSFSPFQFSPDMKTFSMAKTFVTKTESPKQTAHIALAGREVRRTCVQDVPPCP